MKVSIVIPNYNKEEFIATTLSSLMSQTYSNWEAIIVDDNSTDRSRNIINHYISEDSRFILISNTMEGRGASVCRNIGLSSASGELIIFLDSDDVLLPTCLHNRIEFITKNNELDFAVFPLQTFKNDINDKLHIWDPGKVNNHLLAFLQHQLPWQTMCPIWKKDFLNKIGGFDPKYKRYDDVELHTRALLVPDVKYLAPKNMPPDCCYFIGQDRMTFNFQSILDRVASDTRHYILATSNALNEQNRYNNRHLRYLKGTIFAFFKQVFIFYQHGEISSFTKDSFIERMKNFEEIKDFLSERDLAFLNLYCKGASMTKRRIKGYNFLMKKIFIHLV